MRGGAVPNPIWAGSKWLLAFKRTSVILGTFLIQIIFLPCCLLNDRRRAALNLHCSNWFIWPPLPMQRSFSTLVDKHPVLLPSILYLLFRIDSFFLSIFSSSRHFLILGDFNCHYLLWDSKILLTPVGSILFGHHL